MRAVNHGMDGNRILCCSFWVLILMLPVLAAADPAEDAPGLCLILPDSLDSDEGAIEILYNRLVADSVYDRAAMEDFSYSIEYMDGCEPEVYRDYRDVAIREIHRCGGSGDPDTAPIVDRFRIYPCTGEILWWHPLYGENVPYSELLVFRGE